MAEWVSTLKKVVFKKRTKTRAEKLNPICENVLVCRITETLCANSTQNMKYCLDASVS